ncbi:hypothetical protein I4U23_003354 [Adineta vaga]|nr:hypothetical protein I4U23_003354 [Adineta vaga]
MSLIYLVFILIISNVSSNLILSEYEQCSAPLGMESGLITDSDLTSSSTHDMSSVGPQMARIRTELEGGAWCPDKPIGPKSYEYIQIELHKLFFINTIETQGRFDNGQGNEFAEYYQVLKGNMNTYSAEKRLLSPAIIATRIRIIPYSPRWRTVCMRVELYGCPFHGGVISYTTSPSIDQDDIYDGGLGKLIDGIIGSDDSTWLAWNKSPVMIDFNFDTYRQFKNIRIYSMNNKYRSIEMKFDDNQPIVHRPTFITTSVSTVFVDTIDFEDDGTIIIGKHLEILFEFDNEFLFLTEIKIDNEPTTIIQTNTMTTTCETTCLVSHNNLTLITSSSPSSSIYTLESLTMTIILILSVCFLLLFILLILRIRHRCLRKKSNLYYKCSQLLNSTNDSTVVKDPNQHSRKNNYDDLSPVESYLYPITSTSTLLNPGSPSSLFKNEQYAIIDGNTYTHLPTNNTFHYASLDIGQVPSKLVTLFNCIALRESIPSKSYDSLPPFVDESKLYTLCKISESKYGEIILGKYESRPALIKIIKKHCLESTRQKFLSELTILTRLNHHNIACICAVQLDLLCLIQEHSDFGTLQNYFRTQVNDTTFQKKNIYFSHQLSNALEYLSSLNIIHNDIAARNCLFFPDYSIKLTDCAIALSQYEKEYWICTNGDKIPLRWIAPEALTNNTTIKSDIYSFAITLWEFWSRCLTLPHASLTNEDLYQYLVMRQSSYKIENPNVSIFRLSQPSECPKEIYDLLCECWHIDGNKRPHISDIALYFRRQINIS